ncbi:hypothetical protein KR067_000479, partial [Drosophila pandora]
QVACLLITWSIQLSGSRAATILHGSAISHQSFTRLSSSSEPLILQQPNPQQLVRIVVPQRVREQSLERFRFETHAEEPQVLSQTPAHLTYAARPVVHQMLPQIKPVRNISFASLLPGPRSLATNNNISPV